MVDQGIRYGSRAFQGVFLKGSDLPFNFTTKGVIGKSNFNRSSLETDNFTGSLQVKNSLNNSTKIAAIILIHGQIQDSLSDKNRSYFIHTLELRKAWNKLEFSNGVGTW